MINDSPRGKSHGVTPEYGMNTFAEDIVVLTQTLRYDIPRRMTEMPSALWTRAYTYNDDGSRM